MNVFDEALVSLKEAIDFEKGDLSKGRITEKEFELDASYKIYKKVLGMSETNRSKVAGYIDGLLRASGQ
ncbi:MAG: hypothetical protein FWE90_06550 [Defluviitaleaceae bacterium]|nr:hypothetical protein [Defluviitaleaceae bacterium]